MELRLLSPVGAGREYDLVYVWPSTDDKEVNYSEEDLAEEIRETFSAVLCDHPGINLLIPPIRELCEYGALKKLCDKWNDLIDNYTSCRTFRSTKATLPQAQHIIGQVYNRTVTYPERLNQYSAFSPNVYGETSPKMVSHMIRQLDITEDDTFLDLGSGVGQVVLQMAAAANFKRCVGIETCETPCEYAVGLQNEFKKVMKWYGKGYTEFHLYNGDFLDSKFRDTILKSSIIFANNYAFGPEVDHRLKEIFADLDQGVRIVSSKEFSSPNFRINNRNLSDIGTIMNVSTMCPFEGAVSWTHSKVSFYLHEIDRTKLELYFEECAKGHQQNAVPLEKTKRRGGRSSNSLDRKDDVDGGLKPKKRSTAPRMKFALPSKKKPKKSASSTNRRFFDEEISNEAAILEAQLLEARASPREMPELEPEILEPQRPLQKVQLKRPKLHSELLGQNSNTHHCRRSDQKYQVDILSEINGPSMRPHLSRQGSLLNPNTVDPQPYKPVDSQNKKLEPLLVQAKSVKVRAPNDVEGNRSKPPKKRKSEVEILQNTWDIYRKENQVVNTSHAPSTSSPPNDPYADAPWRNIQITDSPPKCVDELLARLRVQYFDMLKNMQDYAYRKKILDEIRVAQEWNEQLKKNRAYFEEVVRTLLADGTKLLTAKMAELDYEPNDVEDMIHELQFQCSRQASLSLQKAALQREVIQLEKDARQLLVPGINKQVDTKHRLKKAVTELTDQLHHITSQTPPTVFPDSPPSEGGYTAEDAMLPARLYVNDVRMFERLNPHEDSGPGPGKPCSAALSPAIIACESTIPQYKVSPSSILPKKRR